jgi:two-component system, chemotaxis family, protein-glutamate methylesterase/glutaminase
VAHRDIVVIGASAGGVEALQQLVRSLPVNFPAAIFVAMHFPEHGTSVMPRILARAGKLPAVHAANGDSIVPGRIYVAPPDHHTLLAPDSVRLVRGPRENGNRPAIDPLFRSAAIAFGARVIGVVLTGNLDDGTAGLAAIKRRGGLAVVQDPEDALFPSMPRSALENVTVDRVAPISHLGKILGELVEQTVPEQEVAVPKRDAMENALSSVNLDAIQADESEHPGTVSPYGCPDCGGVLWELRDGEFTRFRCRVGHAWTGDALLAQQADSLDDALWTALRALEESASLSRQIARRHHGRGSERLANRFKEQAESMEARATLIRNVLVQARDTQGAEDAEPLPPRQAS